MCDMEQMCESSRTLIACRTPTKNMHRSPAPPPLHLPSVSCGSCLRSRHITSSCRWIGKSLRTTMRVEFLLLGLVALTSLHASTGEHSLCRVLIVLPLRQMALCRTRRSKDSPSWCIGKGSTSPQRRHRNKQHASFSFGARPSSWSWHVAWRGRSQGVMNWEKPQN